MSGFINLSILIKQKIDLNFVNKNSIQGFKCMDTTLSIFFSTSQKHNKYFLKYWLVSFLPTSSHSSFIATGLPSDLEYYMLVF